MEKVGIIGLDLAKRSFQAHGALTEGCVAFRKKLSREKVLGFFAEQTRCIVAMEACGSAHHWGRAIRDLDHEVRLIPPIYVKPFVKRQKNDAADSEAIAEAASRPTMRFVTVKTEEQQARAMLFRTRDLLVRQRTQLINALRGHLSEHGVVAAQGQANVKVLEAAIEDQTTTLPLLVVELARVFLDQIEGLSMLFPPMPLREPSPSQALRSFPRQHSTGGKQALGKISKMGQRDNGVCGRFRASAQSRPWRSRPSRRRWMSSNAGAILPHGSDWLEGSWLQHMLARKPKMLVAIALANKMARSVWAMLAKGEDFRVPVVAVS